MRNSGYAKAKTPVITASNTPLRPSAFDVPMLSAIAPKGTELRGMTPKVIIAMLIIRPRISGDEYTCIRVILRDIKTALSRPSKRRKGKAIA